MDILKLNRKFRALLAKNSANKMGKNSRNSFTHSIRSFIQIYIQWARFSIGIFFGKNDATLMRFGFVKVIFRGSRK